VGEADAAVDGPVSDALAFRFAEHYRAGAAVAFPASFLRAGAFQVLPQHFQKRALGWYIAQRDKLAAADESDRFRFHETQYG
jgi:hypothetical protein